MLTEAMIGMARRRRQASRPFEGHTKESLLRKIESRAVREGVKEQVRRELQLRTSVPLSY